MWFGGFSPYYRPASTEGGPSWLTFIGHMKDSFWNLDLFRDESIALQTAFCPTS